MPASVTIRPAVRGDAAAVARLLGELGYPATEEEVIARLSRLNSFKDALVLVADIEEEVVGAITGHVIPSIHDTLPVAQLTALVVSAERRKSGIGAQLTAAIEQWARDHGAARITLTSAMHRQGAHTFYERLGYERTGMRLAKKL